MVFLLWMIKNHLKWHRWKSQILLNVINRPFIRQTTHQIRVHSDIWMIFWIVKSNQHQEQLFSSMKQHAQRLALSRSMQSKQINKFISKFYAFQQICDARNVKCDTCRKLPCQLSYALVNSARSYDVFMRSNCVCKLQTCCDVFE